jgi:predicted phosphodiesterase
VNETRVAVLSDIHGNVRALDAVLGDVRRRGIDAVVNLGDCLYGPFDPRPVADRLLAFDWPTVAGNEDRCLLDAKALEASAAARFTRRHLSLGHLEWLASLPKTRELDGGVLAFHGTPTDDRVYLLTALDPDGGTRRARPDEIVKRLDGVDGPLILCGHDHMPRVVHLSDGRTVANPGSVGCPAYADDHPVSHAVENGRPHARCAVVTLEADRVDVEQVAVVYDWEAAAREAERNGFPDWARWLATGRAVAHP